MNKVWFQEGIKKVKCVKTFFRSFERIKPALILNLANVPSQYFKPMFHFYTPWKRFSHLLRGYRSWCCQICKSDTGNQGNIYLEEKNKKCIFILKSRWVVSDIWTLSILTSNSYMTFFREKPALLFFYVNP